MKQEILSHQQIQQKINRLAFQIMENTFELDTIYIGGITGNGIVLGQLLKNVIELHSQQTVVLFEIQLDKENPYQAPIEITLEGSRLKGQTVILVDDVLNSGKTMQHGLVKILEQEPRHIYTVVLVDRKHRRYPIKANFFGLRLSTILQDHIEVSLVPDKYSVQLF